MHEKLNRLFGLLFARPIRRIHLSENDRLTLHNTPPKTRLVYVLKQASLLEFLFFNALFLQESLPRAEWAPQIRAWLLFWLTPQTALRGLYDWILSRWPAPYDKRKAKISDEIKTFFTKNSITSNMSLSSLPPLLLCLTPEARDTDKRWNHLTPLTGRDYLDALLHQTSENEDALRLVPLHYIYDYHTNKAPSRWTRFLADFRFKQNWPHRFISFVWGSHKQGKLWLGNAIDLSPQAIHSLTADQLEDTLTHVFESERRRLAGPTLDTPQDLLRELWLDPSFQDALRDFSINPPYPPFTKGEMANTDSSSKREMANTQSVLERDITNTQPHSDLLGHQNRMPLRQVISRYFYEIAADLNPSFLILYDLLLGFFFRKLYRDIHLDEGALNKLRTLDQHATIVLVPNHRSHADYLLMSYVFYEHHLTPPHICGGINLSFWPMGYFFRRGGCFFIHRKIDENSLYALTLKAYLKALVRRGTTIEFFIEGTRSRTGKLLKPKTGLLRYLLDAHRAHPEKPLYFVPVSITYDQIVEEKSYSEERKGHVKKRESTRDLLHLRKLLRHDYGQVYLRFSDPILAQHHSDESVAHEADRLAPEIAHAINRKLVITASALVAMALLETSDSENGTLTIDYTRIWHRFKHYLDYARYRDRPLSPLLDRNPVRAMDDALSRFERAHTLTRRKTDVSQTITYTVPKEKRINLDYYKNNAAHFFVSLGCVAQAILSAPTSPLLLPDLSTQTTHLLEILKREFYISTQDPEPHVHHLLNYLEKIGAIRRIRNKIYPENRDLLSLFSRVIDPYLDA